MDDRCPICQAAASERHEEVILPCCKNVMCSDCLVAWQQNSNVCPLCKTPFQDVEIAKRAALDALLQQVVGANRLLQKLSSLYGHAPLNEPDKMLEISHALTDVLDNAIKLGFGPPPEREPAIHPVSGSLFSRELLSFALAAALMNEESPEIEFRVSRSEGNSDWTDEDSESNASANSDDEITINPAPL